MSFPLILDNNNNNNSSRIVVVSGVDSETEPRQLAAPSQSPTRLLIGTGDYTLEWAQIMVEHY